MKITPVLVVDRIEPSLAFWVDRIGFEKTVEVPHGDHLGFVILKYGEAELMLQTLGSVQADVPAVAGLLAQHRSDVFLEVQDLDTILARTGDLTPLVPVRTTFYGMRELLLQEPGGHVVCFAAPVATANTV